MNAEYTPADLIEDFQDACVKHQKCNAHEYYEQIMDNCSKDDAKDALDDYLAEFRGIY